MAGSGRYSVEIDVSQERKREEAQVDRFRRVAQELGCDENEAAFDEKLKEVVGPKPLDRPAVTPKLPTLKHTKKDAPDKGAD